MPVVPTPLVASAGSERIRVVSPLGIRFWDPVTDTQITGGLTVRARSATDPSARPVTATVTPGGIFAFRRLPTLHAVEYPTGLEETDFTTTTEFEVTVADDRERYIPARFTVPVPHDGIYPTAVGGDPGNGTVPDAPQGFYLFPAPTRIAPPGTATVRAQLVIDEAGTPAPFAVARIDVAGASFFGISNPAGAVAVQFPYPSFAALPDISSTDAIAPQQWAVTVSVRSHPADLGPPPFREVPTFTAIRAQAAAEIQLDETTAALSMSAALVYGRDLVLITGGANRSELRITPPS